ncbi:MAG: DUF4254 domain-containing protein [Planctomycetota bacterium]|nr:DUF4254 domain-containing protein [Planctomycetota bacterium]MDA1212132.1 DUF4254 domain-containing protein [Planctomycetota bacterium]
MLLDVAAVVQMQFETVERWHQPDRENRYSGLMALICDQHHDNFSLWHEEDLARDPQSSDVEIAAVKRRIDKLNQSRNDRIEQIDDWIAQEVQRRNIVVRADARVNTESPGSAVDRLSIMALRLYHLEEQRRRTDVGVDHVVSLNQKIAVCEAQHLRLSQALAALLDEIERGTCRHECFRQFKMYNDKTLNPYLYRAASHPQTS